jgi:serine/threonine-protein kinase
MGIREWTASIVAWTLIAIAAAIQFKEGRSTARRAPEVRYGSFIASTLAIAVSSLSTGPYMLIPALLVANTVGWAVQPHAPRGRLWTIGIGMMGLLLPVGASLLGLIPQSYVFKDGHIEVMPIMNALPERATLVMLFATSSATIITLCLFVGSVREALTAAEKKLHLHAWQLRQLVPEEARLSRVDPREIQRSSMSAPIGT